MLSVDFMLLVCCLFLGLVTGSGAGLGAIWMFLLRLRMWLLVV